MKYTLLCALMLTPLMHGMDSSSESKSYIPDEKIVKILTDRIVTVKQLLPTAKRGVRLLQGRLRTIPELKLCADALDIDEQDDSTNVTELPAGPLIKHLLTHNPEDIYEEDIDDDDIKITEPTDQMIALAHQLSDLQTKLICLLNAFEQGRDMLKDKEKPDTDQIKNMMDTLIRTHDKKLEATEERICGAQKLSEEMMLRTIRSDINKSLDLYASQKANGGWCTIS